MKRWGRAFVIVGSVVVLAHPAGAEIGWALRIPPRTDQPGWGRRGRGARAHRLLPDLRAGTGGGRRCCPRYRFLGGPQRAHRRRTRNACGHGSVVIGTEWDGTGFAGGSQSYTASTTCSSTTTWQVPNVGPEWNDRFSSGKGLGGCDTNRKFQHENFGGNVRVCTPNCADYGALGNQVTSLRWRI